MARWEYRKGLHEVGEGLYAYLQPDGGWGWSNAGLVVHGQQTLLVDTLFDLRLTTEMLETMRRLVPAARRIDTLVNTHANGDHCWGNQLVEGARIVASRRTAEELVEGLQPASLAGLLEQAPGLGQLGQYALRIFGPFDFKGITVTPPSETFGEELTLHVGDREVRLLEVGPAHTQGDTLVWLPAERVLFAGDILFNGGHPIVWAGPVRNWTAACERILNMDLEVVVPGHGPITDKRAVAELKSYFEYLEGEARKRFDAGLSPLEAARDIPLDRWANWGEAERLVVNVAQLYREFSGAPTPLEAASLMGQMAELVRR